MKRIYLLRHAKAEKSGEMDDKLRVLVERGQEDARNLGDWLRRNDALIEHALSSPALRTRLTFQHLKEAFPALPAPAWEESLYQAGAGQIFSILQAQDDAVSSILIVGHNPSIRECAVRLAEEIPQEAEPFFFTFSPCSLVAFDVPIERWRNLAPGMGAITRWMCPALMSA